MRLGWLRGHRHEVLRHLVRRVRHREVRRHRILRRHLHLVRLVRDVRRRVLVHRRSVRDGQRSLLVCRRLGGRSLPGRASCRGSDVRVRLDVRCLGVLRRPEVRRRDLGVLGVHLGRPAVGEVLLGEARRSRLGGACPGRRRRGCFLGEGLLGEDVVLPALALQDGVPRRMLALRGIPSLPSSLVRAWVPLVWELQAWVLLLVQLPVLLVLLVLLA